jgi:AcrR family transcriptional regulator
MPSTGADLVGDATPLVDGRRKKSVVRRGLVRQQIVEQAERLFAEQGYAATSLQDIADAVGLTRPALYHYFRRKDDILAGLVNEIVVGAAAEVARIAEHRDRSATGRLRDIVRLMVRCQGERSELFRIVLRSEAAFPELAAGGCAANYRAILRSITWVVAQGKARGEFRRMTPTVAALGILGIINGAAWWYHPRSPHDVDRISVELADQAVRSLAATPDRLASTTLHGAIERIRTEIERLERMLGEA